jgi:sulfite reductase beta subunit-like hemoprotein
MGARLATLCRHGVRFEEVAAVLAPLFQAYAEHTAADERFGDWAARVGLAQAGFREQAA